MMRNIHSCIRWSLLTTDQRPMYGKRQNIWRFGEFISQMYKSNVHVYSSLQCSFNQPSNKLGNVSWKKACLWVEVGDGIQYVEELGGIFYTQKMLLKYVIICWKVVLSQNIERYYLI